MHRGLIALTLLALAAALAGCSGSAASTATARPDTYASSNIDTSYPDAMSARNQLALGTLRLDDTDNPVTPEQAATLLPLWQGVRGTLRSGASAQVEVNTLLGQIEAGMSTDQLAAIRAMQLTQVDLQDWTQSQGLSVGTGSGQPGAGRDLPPDARAALEAQGGAGGNRGGTSLVIVDAVIEFLTARANS